MNGKKKLNLLSAEIKNKHLNKYLIYAAAVICGIFVLALSVQYINIAVLNHSIHTAQKENERYNEEKTKMEQLQKKIVEHKQFLENYSDESFPFSMFMHDIERCRPYSVSIISVDSKDRLINEGEQEKDEEEKSSENSEEPLEKPSEEPETTENEADGSAEAKQETPEQEGKIEYVKDLSGEEISVRGYGTNQEEISEFIYSISKLSYINSAKIAAIEQRELEGNLVNVFEILITGGAVN